MKICKQIPYKDLTYNEASHYLDHLEEKGKISAMLNFPGIKTFLEEKNYLKNL